MVPVSEIKLIRADTTLDLSQKAEKVCGDMKVMMAELYDQHTFSGVWDVKTHQTKITLEEELQEKAVPIYIT